MEYSVQYKHTTNNSIKRSKKYPYGTLWLILVGMLCLQWFYSSGISLMELIVPGDMEITLPAINRLVEALAAGDSIGDSVSAFCYDVFQTM